MAATESSSNEQKQSSSLDAQEKTIFSILSKIKEAEPNNKNKDTHSIEQRNLEHSEENDDIVILRKDPSTKRNTINKTAYLKLHRSSSPNRSSTIEKIKEQYEKNDKVVLTGTIADVSQKEETLESIKNKYSPAGLGYTKPQPAPRPRRSKLSRSQIIVSSKKDPIKTARLSLNIEKNKNKDVNSNNLLPSKENCSSDEEYINIVTRSDSEESIYKFQKELSAFTMDKKKRANSFRKIFSVFSNKDKKKKQDDKNKVQNKENGETYSDNLHNESNSFNRQAPFRHTTGGEQNSFKSLHGVKVDSNNRISKQMDSAQIEKDYAGMHINQFNRFKQNFDAPTNQNFIPEHTVTHDGYTVMDKPIYKSNGDNSNYMNMPSIRKYIDTSSSASTLESDRSNFYQNETLQIHNQNIESRDHVELRHYPTSSFRPNKMNDGRRDTPPRLLETQQDVRLVNPKALIPINSERPLPNPYQNVNKDLPTNPLTQSYSQLHGSPSNLNKNDEVELRRPRLEDTYGTVLDSLEQRQRMIKAQNKHQQKPTDEKPPRSPSLEPSKLKLPPNRNIVPLSPRVKSPIPPDTISTEKMIATELLRPKRSPTPTKRRIQDLGHQRFEIDIDYPDNVNFSSRNNLLRSTDNLMDKPPVAAKPIIQRSPDNSRINNENYRINSVTRNSLNVSPRERIPDVSPIHSPDRVTTNVQVHMNSPVNRTPTPRNSMQNVSLSPVRTPNSHVRPSTPSGSRIPESPQTTPQKEDIRKSVEAYYWKEIKKLKDQENQELYMLQMYYGNMFPFGYAEDPINVRRSRSISPSANRNGRRSLSLPRESKSSVNIIPERRYPNAIPENRAVTNQTQPRSVQQLQFQQQQYFIRNTPERRTVDGSPRNYENNTNSLYKPIFKRGSLNTPPNQLPDDSLKRKVSFSGTRNVDVKSWPTKNGYTQSPPQRRIDKLQSQEDDEVFLPNTPKIVIENRYRYPETNIRPDLHNEEIYYNTRKNIIAQDGQATYISRSTNNAMSMHQQRQPIQNQYVQRINQSPKYIPNRSEEVLYGQPVDAVRPVIKGLTRHGSIQINEQLYGQKPDPRRISYQNNSLARPSVSSTPVPSQEVQYVSRQPTNHQGVQPQKREIIINDEIFGQFGGYVGPTNIVRVVQDQNVYASRQSIAEYNSRVRDEYYNRPNQRQVTMTNRVCDIYGRIHDNELPRVQQSGMIMGQLHRSPGSPAVVRTSHSQLPGNEQFVRNSRLTASANDMYRRGQTIPPQYSKDYQYGTIEPNVQNSSVAPNRPLPPVPQGKKGLSKGIIQRQNLVSDTESGSDASEIQRILNSNSKNKKRGIFGK